MNTDAYGFGVGVYSDSSGTLHLDFSQFLEGDPRVVQADDLMGVLANPGDYDWEGCELLGSGLMNASKGRNVPRNLQLSLAAKVDSDSLSDPRVAGSSTQFRVTTAGDLSFSHTISLWGSDQQFTSDITVNGKSLVGTV